MLPEPSDRRSGSANHRRDQATLDARSRIQAADPAAAVGPGNSSENERMMILSLSRGAAAVVEPAAERFRGEGQAGEGSYS